MHAFAAQLTTRPQWVPLVAAALVLVVARRLRPGLALAAGLGWCIAALGMAGVLLGERLAFVLAPSAHHGEAAYLGAWRYLIPLLAGLACGLPVAIRHNALRAWTHVDAILAGCTLTLLGTAWSQLLPR